MKITMNIAEQKSIEKIWIVLQEIQEKQQILQDDDATIDFPKEPSGFYLKALLEIEGGEMRRSAILNARAEIIKGLARRGVIDIEEEMFSTIRFTTTDKFDSFYKEIEKKYNTIRKSKENKTEQKIQLKDSEKRKTLITKDKTTGDFYYKNKLIKFENKEAIYYLIFSCLYENGDLEGFCSYEIINRYLEEHGKEKYSNEQQIMDRIKNGIINLFRFSNLPLKAPDGKNLIRKVRGKGIILYNPPL